MSDYATRFHVHKGIYYLVEKSIIPMVYYHSEVYIMQEDRIVFVGSTEGSIGWMERNENKKMPMYPAVCLEKV